MKRFACNDKGFFLTEQLIALMLTSILASATVYLWQVIEAYQVNPVHLSQHEVETLATRLQKEAALAEELWVTNNQLHLQVEGRQISYLFQNNRLSRRVDGGGGEIAMYNVAAFQATSGSNQSAHLQITGNDGQAHTIYLITFLGGLAHE